jgi:aryl-alcohol dehydrogenase-like predicted oxidoreductase
MEHRNVGGSGLQVSAVGLGCNNFGMRIDLAQTKEVVNTALDAGITLFDTADVYGGNGRSEEFLGQALAGRRHEVVLATKFGMAMGQAPHLTGGASRRYVIAATEASLRRLNTDYIDLLQVHFPDPKTPIEETLRALDDLVRAGKVRYIGSSNLSGWQALEAHFVAKQAGLTAYVSAQNEYNLLFRGIEADLVPVAVKYGIGILPYFPLASGFLTGKYKRGEEAPAGTRFGEWFKGPYGARTINDRNFDILEKLDAFASARGKTVLDVAMAWLSGKPYIPSVINGATRPEQIQQNVAAASWKLTPEEMAEVDGLAK